MMNSSSRKAGVVAAIAFGMILATGSVGVPLVGAEDMPAGFKKGELAPEPSAEMIEAGKRVYFTKCVWCHGVDGAGDGPGADRLWPRPRNFNQGTFKIRHTASGELPSRACAAMSDSTTLESTTEPPSATAVSARTSSPRSWRRSLSRYARRSEPPSSSATP